MTKPNYPYDEDYPFVVHSPRSGALARFKKEVDGNRYIDKVQARTLGWEVIDTTPLKFEKGFYLHMSTLVYFYDPAEGWYKVNESFKRIPEPERWILVALKPMRVVRADA